MGAQQSAAGTKSTDANPTDNNNQTGQVSNTLASTSASNSSTSLPLYTPSDVSLHRSPGDAWVIIHGFVYDLTTFMRSHPGGIQSILDVAGEDGSEAFDMAFHPDEAKDEMKQYCIGRVDTEGTSAPTKNGAATTADSTDATTSNASETTVEADAPKTDIRVKLVYGSQRGAGQRFAERIVEACQALGASFPNHRLVASLVPMNEFDPEDLGKEQFVVFVVSTYTDGQPPDSAKFFCDWLNEAAVDFRVGPEFMANVTYAVLGLGNSLYEHNYNVVAKRMFDQLPSMGGTLLCELGLADDSVSRDDTATAQDDFNGWVENQLLPNLALAIQQPKAFEQKVKIARNKAKTALRAAAREKRRQADKAKARAEKELKVDDENGEEDGEHSASDGEQPEDDEHDGSDNDVDGEEEAADEDGDGSDTEKVVDLEELGSVLTKQKLNAASSSSSSTGGSSTAEKPAPRAMLTDQLRKNLSKQGYKLIGSHSGVKLCRWTKAMLRGRGGCYKHTMYGIISYQCMEMTPSLACANKCVFCWRTHTNPVGTSWRWQVDEPRMIIDNAIANHRTMINTMKGVPGVKPERLADAQKPRHCALSLVGEPIMYPHINEFVRMLHGEGISSFLVTNAQFPKEVAAMEPVTQLYVSIDAATQDSLKAVDRPLFKDFWDRFLACLEAIRHKPQRTVYRLTLVKTFNMQEVIEYAKLISIGRPTFIEIKAVTFVGESKAGSVTMRDVPLHEEVKAFAEQICKYLDGSYEMASEHEHSCCVLISDTKMKKDGKWHTWIDYPKFNQLVTEYYATGKTFSAEDYSAETPTWACYGAKEAGFSPLETKTTTKSKKARPTLAELNEKYPGLNEANYQAQQANIKAHGLDAADASSSSSQPAAVLIEQ